MHTVPVSVPETMPLNNFVPQNYQEQLASSYVPLNYAPMQAAQTPLINQNNLNQSTANLQAIVNLLSSAINAEQQNWNRVQTQQNLDFSRPQNMNFGGAGSTMLLPDRTISSMSSNYAQPNYSSAVTQPFSIPPTNQLSYLAPSPSSHPNSFRFSESSTPSTQELIDQQLSLQRTVKNLLNNQPRVL